MTKSRHGHGTDPQAWLREHGLRATLGRMGIIRLLDASDVPLTLQEIHDRVGGKSCDFATVFRFISILEEKALVEKVAWMDGTTRHELKAEDGHHHHYLICRTCRRVEPVDGCAVERLENQIASKRGYTAINHTLQLSGVCPSCQGSRAKATQKNKTNKTNKKGKTNKTA